MIPVPPIDDQKKIADTLDTICSDIDFAIEKALAEANKQGIKGKAVTPFLLKTIVELTDGESLESNIKLVLNNAVLGAKIAKEYKEL